jgi:xanthine dehydrogenase molybdenum-binding subunit
VDVRNKWHPPGTKILPNGKYHGFGFGVCEMWTHVLGDKGGSHIGLSLRPDGTLTIKTLRGDQGTGFQAAWVRAAADEMGMLVEDVDCQGIHEEETFHAHDEGCSGGTISNVMSIIKAARELKKWVLEAATFDEDCWVVRSHGASYTNLKSPFPDKTPEEMDIKDSMVFEKANPDNKVPLSDVVSNIDPGSFGGEHRRPLFEWGWSRNIDPVLDPDFAEELHGWPCMIRSVLFIEVEVDPETGEVDVVNGAAAHDCGKAFYPEGCEQEDFGGLLQGTSRTRLEEQIYDPQTGVQLNDNLIGYPISLMKDFAHPIPYVIETGGGYGPYGATGNGETPGALGQSPVLVAVHNAIGKWVDAPCTPDRVLKALGKI